MRRYIAGVLIAAAVMAGLGFLKKQPAPEMPAPGTGSGLDAMYQQGTNAVLQDMADRPSQPASR